MVETPDLFASLRFVADQPLRAHADELVASGSVLDENGSAVGFFLVAFGSSHRRSVGSPHCFASGYLQSRHKLLIGPIADEDDEIISNEGGTAWSDAVIDLDFPVPDDFFCFAIQGVGAERSEMSNDEIATEDWSRRSLAV